MHSPARTTLEYPWHLFLALAEDKSRSSYAHLEKVLKLLFDSVGVEHLYSSTKLMGQDANVADPEAELKKEMTDYTIQQNSIQHVYRLLLKILGR